MSYANSNGLDQPADMQADLNHHCLHITGHLCPMQAVMV